MAQNSDIFYTYGLAAGRNKHLSFLIAHMYFGRLAGRLKEPMKFVFFVFNYVDQTVLFELAAKRSADEMLMSAAL